MLNKKLLMFLIAKNLFQMLNSIRIALKKYSTDDIDFQEIRTLICELQDADNKADVWRYLMNKE